MLARQPYLRWLGVAALADWLITRTVTRAGIFIPKTPVFLAAYQSLTAIGQFASTLAGLMAIGVLVWIAWRALFTLPNRLLGGLLLLLVGLSLGFLFVPPGWGLRLLAHLAFIGSAGWLGARSARERPGLTILIGAYLVGGTYLLLPDVYGLMGWPGPPTASGAIFNLGELLVVGCGFAFWWYWGRRASLHDWALAALPVAVFSGMVLSVPAMTGILSIWSTGLTMYLPWPLYALSLWLAGVTLAYNFRLGNSGVGWALLLVAAGGYTPQLSSQLFFGLIGLWVLGESQAMGATTTVGLPRPRPARPFRAHQDTTAG